MNEPKERELAKILIREQMIEELAIDYIKQCEADDLYNELKEKSNFTRKELKEIKKLQARLEELAIKGNIKNSTRSYKEEPDDERLLEHYLDIVASEELWTLYDQFDIDDLLKSGKVVILPDSPEARLLYG